MVSLAPVEVSTISALKAYSEYPGRPLHRRATASGTVRTRNEFEEDNMEEPPQTPLKRARVAFNPILDVQFMGSPAKPVDLVREEVRQALQGRPLGEMTAYDKVIAAFMTSATDADAPSSATIQNYLLVLTGYVADLKPSCSSLVDAILHLEWLGRDDTFVKLYTRFLGHLASAQGQYVALILRTLVRRLSGYSSTAIHVPNYPHITRAQVYDRVHSAIRDILRIIPSSGVALMSIVSQLFPHSTETTRYHADYVRNLLQMLDYAPELQAEVTELITDRLVKIDVQVQDDLDDFEDISGEDLLDMLDPLNVDDSSDEEDGDLDAETRRHKELQSSVQTMDTVLSILFPYYGELFSRPDTAESTFATLLHQFTSTILPTFRSRHTQFLLFVFSQTSSSFMDFFVGACLSTSLDEKRPLVHRRSAAAYLASYISRAARLDRSIVRTAVSLITSYLDDFMVLRKNDCSGPDVHRFGAFYSLFQGLLYIFCFRWRDLLELDDEVLDDPSFDPADHEVEWIPGLKETVRRAVHSAFDPLRVCSPTVVGQFEDVARASRFVYISSILAANARSGSTLAKNDEGAVLETFFPFDPYKLPLSKRWVETVYVEWQGTGDDEDLSDDDHDDDDHTPEI